MTSLKGKAGRRMMTSLGSKLYCAWIPPNLWISGHVRNSRAWFLSTEALEPEYLCSNPGSDLSI